MSWVCFPMALEIATRIPKLGRGPGRVWAQSGLMRARVATARLAGRLGPELQKCEF